MKQPAKEREIHKLKTRLSLRERQCKRAEAALKMITRFESAHCSVFETEVHQLQRQAILALCEMQEMAEGKVPLTGQALVNRRSELVRKIMANQRYGRVTPEGQLYGCEDD